MKIFLHIPKTRHLKNKVKLKSLFWKECWRFLFWDIAENEQDWFTWRPPSSVICKTFGSLQFSKSCSFINIFMHKYVAHFLSFYKCSNFCYYNIKLTIENFPHSHIWFVNTRTKGVFAKQAAHISKVFFWLYQRLN